MGQHVEFLDEQASVLDELLSRFALDEAGARNLLARYGFRDVDVFKSISVLSGGERARLYLCCLLLEQPDLLLLDEPTNHLDIHSREILEQALLEFPGAIFAVSHDRYFIDKIARRVLGFVGHQVQSFDTYAEYRSKARQEEAAAVTRSKDRKEQEARAARNQESDSASGRVQSLNKAQERRENARRKEQLRQTEKRIEQLEQERSDLETLFSDTATPSDYERYAVVLQEIDDAYALYLELAEDQGT